MNNLTITTTDKDLASDMQSIEIEGIITCRRIRFTNALDPHMMAKANEVATFIIKASGDVAIGVFSAWLYDRLKNKPTNCTKINGVVVSGKSNDVHTQINISINDYHCESKTDKQL